jgi:WD40 repeat protein
MTVPSLGGLTITAVEVTDDGYVLAAQANSGVGYLNVYSITPTALTKYGPTVFPIALPSEPLQIVRNKAGTRYAMRFASAPYFKVLDYTGGGNFADVTSPLAAVINGAPNAIGFSPSGEFISMSFSQNGATYGTVEVWRANAALTQYTHYKSLKTLVNSPGTCTFSPDDRLLHTGGNVASTVFYEPANGAFAKLGEGNVGGWAVTAFGQVKYSLNSKAMLTVHSAAPWFAVYLPASTMVDLPIPAYPAKGQGASQLNPYIKVK